MGWDKLSRFMGSEQVASLVDDKNKSKPCEDAVASGDVPIAILLNRIVAETDDVKKAMLEQQLSEELQVAISPSIALYFSFCFVSCLASWKYPINSSQDCK